MPTDTDYWEAQARGSYELPNKFKLTGEFSWSPNNSKSGAWSKYSELGFEFELPEKLTIKGIETTLSGGVGRYWFGNVAPEIGDYRLPAYTYWHAGVAFKVEPLTLDLRYHNTNLSKEDCYVFTGDPGATPGGAMNNSSNPTACARIGAARRSSPNCRSSWNIQNQNETAAITTARERMMRGAHWRHMTGGLRATVTRASKYLRGSSLAL